MITTNESRKNAYDDKIKTRLSLMNAKLAILGMERSLVLARAERINQGFEGKTNEAQRDAILALHLKDLEDALVEAQKKLLDAQAAYDIASIVVNFYDNVPVLE